MNPYLATLFWGGIVLICIGTILVFANGSNYGNQGAVAFGAMLFGGGFASLLFGLHAAAVVWKKPGHTPGRPGDDS